jgi:hypothetical protein
VPFDSIVVSVAVVAMFALFAAVLLWGDRQTRPDRLQAGSNPAKPAVSEAPRRRAA